MSKKRKKSNMGTWLEVDEENKKVRYVVDPSWIKNTNNDEQKIAFAKLKALVAIYRRAGYAIVDIAINLKKRP